MGLSIVAAKVGRHRWWPGCQPSFLRPWASSCRGRAARPVLRLGGGEGVGTEPRARCVPGVTTPRTGQGASSPSWAGGAPGEPGREGPDTLLPCPCAVGPRVPGPPLAAAPGSRGPRGREPRARATRALQQGSTAQHGPVWGERRGKRAFAHCEDSALTGGVFCFSEKRKGSEGRRDMVQPRL